MIDLRPTIVAKSDQLNADDLIDRALTITVTKVSPRSDEQPIAISYEGDTGKPYLPCKSMRRVLVQLWGPDGSAYIGRSMTLFRDPKVKFGSLEVGGIRISHVSHIQGGVTLALTEKKGAKRGYRVEPLRAQAPMPAEDRVADEPPEPRKRTVQDYIREKLNECGTGAEVRALPEQDETFKKYVDRQSVRDLIAARLEFLALAPPADDGPPDDREFHEEAA